MYGQKQILQCLAIVILISVLNFYRSAIRRDKEIQKNMKLKREQLLLSKEKHRLKNGDSQTLSLSMIADIEVQQNVFDASQNFIDDSGIPFDYDRIDDVCSSGDSDNERLKCLRGRQDNKYTASGYGAIRKINENFICEQNKNDKDQNCDSKVNDKKIAGSGSGSGYSLLNDVDDKNKQSNRVYMNNEVNQNGENCNDNKICNDGDGNHNHGDSDDDNKFILKCDEANDPERGSTDIDSSNVRGDSVVVPNTNQHGKQRGSKTKSISNKRMSRSKINGSNAETSTVLTYVFVTILFASLIKAALDVSKHLREKRQQSSMDDNELIRRCSLQEYSMIKSAGGGNGKRKSVPKIVELVPQSSVDSGCNNQKIKERSLLMSQNPQDYKNGSGITTEPGSPAKPGKLLAGRPIPLLRRCSVPVFGKSPSKLNPKMLRRPSMDSFSEDDSSPDVKRRVRLLNRH